MSSVRPYINKEDVVLFAVHQILGEGGAMGEAGTKTIVTTQALLGESYAQVAM
jgi:hypothetical protein